MYTAKQAYLLREKIPDVEVTVFYIDVRAFGKGFEEFYDRVRESGVNYIRGNASEVYKKAGKLVVSKGGLIKPYGPLSDIIYQKATTYTPVQRRVKEVFDPNKIMNPNRIG